jgi:hypothetical protein
MYVKYVKKSTKSANRNFYTHWTYIVPVYAHFSVTFFSATIDSRDLIFGQKLHIDTPYRFWTHQIPTSCFWLCWFLYTLNIHFVHCICPFLVAFFSATINDRNLIFGHKLHKGAPYHGKRFLTRQIPTSCLPKSSQFILLMINLWVVY